MLSIKNLEAGYGKVQVLHGRGGRGKLVIQYHGLDALDGILEKIRGGSAE